MANAPRSVYTPDDLIKMSWETLKAYPAFFVYGPAAALLVMGLVPALLLWAGIQSVILMLLYIVATVVLTMSYMTASVKWTEAIFSGKKNLDVKEGLRYGLSRIPATLWTALVVVVKSFLWALALFFPFIYKAVAYSFSFKIAQLEGISGGKSTRLSEALVKKGGLFRKVGSSAALAVFLAVAVLAFYAALGVVFGPLFALFGGSAEMGLAIQVVIGLFSAALFLGYMVIFVMHQMYSTFEYLTFREENKSDFANWKKMVEAKI